MDKNNANLGQKFCDCTDTKTLTDNQRNKINDDLEKLVTYQTQLMKVLGTQKITEWYLVTPEIKNKSLVAHCRKKENEYRSKKLPHLDEEFTVLIKEYTDFNVELHRHLLLRDFKIDICVDEPHKVDWNICESEHISNLKRKVEALISGQNLPEDRKKECVNKIVEGYITFYQRGLKVMNKLEKNFPEQYSKLMKIKQSKGEDIEIECIISTLGKNDLLKEVEKKLGDALKEELGEVFQVSGLEQLQKKIIAEWLMLCPLDFGG